MHRAKWLVTLTLPLCLSYVACADHPTPTGPSLTAGLATPPTGASFVPMAAGSGSRSILMVDECDPDSFNAAIGPGTCVNRNGGLPFDNFIALLQRQARVPSWHFSPDVIHVPADMTLPIVNHGGEVHTFTEVEEFGGGIVPTLNALAGTPVPAPECLALGGSDFVAPGSQTAHSFEPGEHENYQCCIHPWMRATTR